jgi:hypothetical protein
MNTLVLPSPESERRIDLLEKVADVARVNSVQRMRVETVPDACQALTEPARDAFKRYGRGIVSVKIPNRSYPIH